MVCNSALAGFTLGTPGYSGALLTIDGGNAASVPSKFNSIGTIYPGERIDILTEANARFGVSQPSLTVTLDQE